MKGFLATVTDKDILGIPFNNEVFFKLKYHLSIIFNDTHILHSRCTRAKQIPEIIIIEGGDEKWVKL
jgi:hypothetical protein